jgi:predicted TIM-barrel fold metal-dependent hydrolase
MLITDAQVHLWRAKPGINPTSSATVGWPDGHGPEQMIAEMDEAGVDRAVIVPPTEVGTNEEARAFCDVYPGRFAVMGALDATAPDARVQLPGWMAQSHTLGARLNFTSGGVVKPSFGNGTLDWFWDEAERRHIPLMLLVGGLSARLYPIAERHPGLTLLVDHMARPSGASGIGSWSDLDDLLRLAKLPNVSVKVSSAPNYSSEPYPYRDIHPHLRRIYDSFGPRRMMWGSDVTRLRGSYRDCVQLFKEALPFLSDADREWILGKSLAETLHWPET